MDRQVNIYTTEQCISHKTHVKPWLGGMDDIDLG
jgi:hypothetical protein